MSELEALLEGAVEVPDGGLDAESVRRRVRQRRALRRGIFVAALAIVLMAPVLLFAARRGGDSAEVDTVGPRDEVVLSVGTTGGWGSPSRMLVEVHSDGSAWVADPRQELQSEPGALRAQLSGAQVDRLRVDVVEIGLDAARLDLDDPVFGMSVSDAGTAVVQVDVGGVRRVHEIYALGGFGERANLAVALEDPGRQADVRKLTARIAILDLLTSVRAEVLAAAHVGGTTPFTIDEERVAAALDSTGLRTARAEEPGSRAGVLWAPQEFSTLRVAFAPVAPLGHPAEDLSERTIAGVVVTTVHDRARYIAVRDLFTCDGLRYDVSTESGSQVQPFGWESNVAFLEALIGALGCGAGAGAG